ncbi:SRPBCC family protein [Hymenobacter guriensis]|uniref:SRPBCC domain-containing protein n=1 Tax=Hymenobacter guriensis TaxID=2793065 RepID=A0ABS0L8K3_9BACT|nr:SRPBCC domain-containing protein [Hymenobacter guriensis]MBG8556245.1 SRPBCC domain-containing protein [Hymenobacter guriensis]
MDKPFVLEQTYDAPIEKVWRALTTPDQLRAWYFPQLKKFEPVAGFEFEFFDDGSPYQKEWQVTHVVDGSKLAHSWGYKGYRGISEVTFELVEQGMKTKLLLTHTGLASFPADPHFARHRFENGWQQILTSNLKTHLELR